MKRLLKALLYLVLFVLIVALGYVLVYFPPVMSGMHAKIMCSCVFVSERTPQSVIEKELQVFPGLASTAYVLDRPDSSVRSTVLWHTSKAIYRDGLGCTLLADQSEDMVRGQQISLPVKMPLNTDSIPWPSGDRLHDGTLPGVDYRQLTWAIDSAFVSTVIDKPVNTHAVVVLYDGKLIGEKYAEGFDRNSMLMGWSMTKSLVNGMIGILVKEGKLALHEPAPVPEWTDKRKSITLNHLLQASSGLSWEESYFVPTSDFHMMFTKSDDKGAYAASRPLEYDPGTRFEYSSGTTNLLSRMIRHVKGDSLYHRFPYEKLFYRIGMRRTVIEPDASGTFVGSSYGFASARDWARFGLLYLQDGVWEGERILPVGWVRYSTSPAPAAPKQEYGAHIWLNAGKRNDATVVKYPGLPHDAFVFDGFEENTVTVIPSRNVVIVRLGVTHHRNFDHPGFVNRVLKALPRPL